MSSPPRPSQPADAPTPVAFAQTLRALNADHGRAAWRAWALATLGVAAWAAWATQSRVDVLQVSQAARLEVRQAAHPLATSVAGRVREHHLQLGAAVEAGQVLVQLDDTEARLRLAEATAHRDALQAQLSAGVRALAERQSQWQREVEADQAALQAAAQRRQEADTAADLAERQARRAVAEAATGAVAPAEVEQTSADARRLQAQRAARIAEQQQLAAQHAAHRAEQQAALQALQSQQAQLAGQLQAQVALRARAEDELARHQLRAPVAGVVGDLATPAPGSVVAAGQRFAQIVPGGELLVVADFDPAGAWGRVQPGQIAQLRLNGFGWVEHGTLAARVARVAGELHEGRLRVELQPQGAWPAQLPRQHGLAGQAEVVIERVAPWRLVLRTIGQAVAGAPAAQAAAGVSS